MNSAGFAHYLHPAYGDRPAADRPQLDQLDRSAFDGELGRRGEVEGVANRRQLPPFVKQVDVAAV